MSFDLSWDWLGCLPATAATEMAKSISGVSQGHVMFSLAQRCPALSLCRSPLLHHRRMGCRTCESGSVHTRATRRLALAMGLLACAPAVLVHLTTESATTTIAWQQFAPRFWQHFQASIPACGPRANTLSSGIKGLPRVIRHQVTWATTHNHCPTPERQRTAVRSSMIVVGTDNTRAWYDDGEQAERIRIPQGALDKKGRSVGGHYFKPLRRRRGTRNAGIQAETRKAW